MRKMMNVLYVTTPEAYLSLDGENVVILVDDETKNRIPLLNLEGIVCFNYKGASPRLMGHCAEKNIGLSFISPSGKFLARVSGPIQGNVTLRKTQYRVSEDTTLSLPVARNMITGKILNARAVVERAVRDHPMQVDVERMKETSGYLLRGANKVQQTESHDVLRGIEGDCAKVYFSVFNDLILQQKDDFQFKGRNKRPPLDYVNALLSFLYTLLTHDVQSALETVGLDPYVGFLHTDRPGRASLALDMVEELRAYLADRLVLSLINRKQINKKDFLIMDNGAVLMDEEARKEVITAWQKRKQEPLTHPFLDEKITIGLVPYAQAMLLARFLRGDLDNYPPFLWK